MRKDRLFSEFAKNGKSRTSLVGSGSVSEWRDDLDDCGVWEIRQIG